MSDRRHVHWAIPATTLGGTPGRRLHGMVLAMFFGGETLVFCRPNAGTWWKVCHVVHRDEDLHRVSCFLCRRALYQRGLLTNEDYPMPLFPHLEKGSP